jgi:hypothetical protein
MEQRVTPGLFYGSALSALIGLVFGLALHGPWESHPGGPQIWFSSAAAEELKRPATAEDAIAAVAQDEPQQVAELDTTYLPPEPLPVTRLDPDRFDPKPAATDPAERVEVEDQVADAAPTPATSERD